MTGRLVITEADPQNRRVIEIDSEPAAQAYANILGLKTEDLNPMAFSKYPVILQIGGKHYVRSIQKVNEDGSLSFYCAIDNGLVLTLAKGIIIPPFGRPIIELDIYVDESITRNDRIAFNAGSLTDSITMDTKDYLELAKPTIYIFSK